MKKTLMSAAMLAAALAASPVSAQEARPSFDCEKAGNAAEKAVCGSAILKMMDRTLARFYRVARQAGGKPVAAAQRKWMKARNACRDDYDCLEEKYASRIIALARAAGDEGGISGFYGYDLRKEESSGSMWLAREADGSLSGALFTLTGSTAHTCDIEFEKASPDGSRWRWKSPDSEELLLKPCLLTITPVKGGVRIKSTNSCLGYCGMRGFFATVYKRLR